MKAKDMFEELGYVLEEEKDMLYWWKKPKEVEFNKYGRNLFSVIEFNKEREIMTFSYTNFGLQLSEATAQQMKELGWLE